MNWAEWILIIALMINLGIVLGKHGEYNTERYNFWLQLLSTVITIIILYNAGLFRGLFNF